MEININQNKIKEFHLNSFYIFIFSFNIIVWSIAFLLFSNFPMQLNFCFVAYILGFRHALDADHISAIDNLTRKLIEERRSPKKVGFLFSLGHSTIVIFLSLFIAILTPKISNNFGLFKEIGSLLGGSISALSLFFISILNVYLFSCVVKKLYIFKIKKSSLLNQPIVIANPFFKKISQFMNKNYQIYLLGFLFGLGFDTATEIALLGISGIQGAQGVLWYQLLIFPVLFTSGMCLIDTTVNLMSIAVCRYATVNSSNAVYFNLLITLFISLTGLFIAGCEFFHLTSLGMNKFPQLWLGIAFIMDHFEAVGCFITSAIMMSLLWFKYLSLRSYSNS